jgi:hypothetical protein
MSDCGWNPGLRDRVGPSAPPRDDANTIHRPSCDQVGSKLSIVIPPPLAGVVLRVQTPVEIT